MFIFKKFWALLTSILLIVTLNAEGTPGKPQGAVLTASHTFMLEQALLRGQGMATDGKYFYFSGNYFLNTTDMKTMETVNKRLLAIPPVLLLKGCNHIGGICCYDGKIYAPIEDGPDYLNSFIAIYDAATLKFTGKYYELPHDLQLAGVAWCAVDAPRGYLYTCEWSNAKVLNVFNLNDMKLVKTVLLSEPLDRIQDAEMYNGTLYLSADIGTKVVYALNPETGAVSVAFTRNVSSEIETEGMTILPTADGPVFCIMDVGPMRINVVLRQYKLAN